MTTEADQQPVNLVAFVAHGGFFSDTGDRIEPTLDVIRNTQQHYIASLAGEPAALQIPRELIYEKVPDTIIANALYLDQLLEAVSPPNQAWIEQINNALRFYYLRTKGEEPPSIGQTWYRGVPQGEVDSLERAGVDIGFTFGADSVARTGSPIAIEAAGGGQTYIEQCRKANVPVPANVLSNDFTEITREGSVQPKTWHNLGVLADSFLFDVNDFDSELWVYTETDADNNPTGVCLALPRWAKYDQNPSWLGEIAEGEAAGFGVICMDVESGNTCFFDNPKGKFFKRGDSPHGIDKFVGGDDLANNGGGACSSCHAGENPFVLYRDKDEEVKSIFERVLDWPKIPHMPNNWHQPIVYKTWPQNPGPIEYLGPVPDDEQSCSSCHNKWSQGGRFPLVSQALDDPTVTSGSGYCQTVLEGVLRDIPDDPDTPYMPAGEDAKQTDYQAHINWLRNACNTQPGASKTVPAPGGDNPYYISAPMIIGPIYGCAANVGLTSLRLDAQVYIDIDDKNGNDKFDGSQVARNTRFVEFSTPQLQPGDIVSAWQVDGPATSIAVQRTVEDYTQAFPNATELPTPGITRTHKCAYRIGISHVPGAELTVKMIEVDGTTTTKTVHGGSGGLTHTSLNGPFEVGDRFEVSQSLCTLGSQRGEQTAVDAPTTLSELETVPSHLYAGQELVSVFGITPGARVDIAEITSGTNIGGTGSWPWTMFFNYDLVWSGLGGPLQENQILEFTQTLCELSSTHQTAPVAPCAIPDPPVIATPIHGDDFVLVVSAEENAIIRVVDEGNNEIGDGSGSVIRLSRPLSHDESIRVTQRVDECLSEAYSVPVGNYVVVNE